MKEQRHRILCAVCALALVLTAVLAPAAWAAEGTDEAQAEAKTTLTAADAAQIPWEVLAKVTNRIVNEVKGVNRVMYDCTGKPPATIEFE